MHKRQAFNQSGPFVVRGGMLMSGVRYPNGAAFPMDGVSPRRLRQLWDLRRIDMAARSIFQELMEGVKDMEKFRMEQSAPESVPFVVPAVSLADLSDDELFARAKAKTGVSYRVRARALKVLESA